MRPVLAIWLGVALACSASAQTSRQLLGKLVKGDDPSSAKPAANAKVVLDVGGGHDISDSDGFFHLFLPDVLRPGDEVTVTVTVPGYAVYEPPLGRLRIPSEPERTRVQIELLPKGSLKFLSDGQLRAFAQGAANESARQPTPPSAKQAPDLEHFLKDWSEQHGIDPEQVRVKVDEWAAKVTSSKAGPYDLSLAAFAVRNFGEAHDRALDAAREDEATLQKQEEEGRNRIIRDYSLAGDAAYNGLDFEQASSAYGKALAQSSRDRNAAQWAGLQLKIGNSEAALISRSEGEAIGRHAESAKKAYQAAFEVYTREQLPQDWATTQNNLGIVLRALGERSEGAQGAAYLEQSVAAYRSALQVYTRDQLPQGWAAAQNNLGNVLLRLGERSEGAQGAAYLEQSVAAYRSALQVRTREQLPQDWAATENNLGVVLRDLGERSEGAQGAAYLEQSVAAYRSALEVRTEDGLPSDWTQSMVNLAQAYEAQKDWTKATQTYQGLLRHDPGNTEWQAKVKELAQKQ